MTATLATRLDARRRDITQAAIDRFRELARDYASGEAIDEDRADAVLVAAGKTAKDLEALKLAFEQRAVLLREVEAGPAAHARKAELNAAFNVARAKLAEAEREFQETVGPLNRESQSLDMVISRADREAPTQLRDNCHRLYPDRFQVIREIQQRIEEARAEAVALRKRANDFELAAQRNEGGPDRFGVTVEGMAASRRQRGDADALRAAAAKVDRRIVELQQEQKAAEAKLLDP